MQKQMRFESYNKEEVNYIFFLKEKEKKKERKIERKL